MRRRGFTFMEMLLVIGVIAVLAAILFPVFARAREQARSQTCRTNLLNIGMALRMYAAEHDGLYPPHDYDMTPLYPRYITTQVIFLCPSELEDLRMVPPDWRPPEPEQPQEPPAMQPGMMEPGMPGGQQPEDEGVLKTAYIFRGGGHRHNRIPLTGLVADSQVRHNEHANVLMSDGAITSVTEGRWVELGFGDELPEYLLLEPESYDTGMPPGMSGPPPPEEAPPS